MREIGEEAGACRPQGRPWEPDRIDRMLGRLGNIYPGAAPDAEEPLADVEVNQCVEDLMPYVTMSPISWLAIEQQVRPKYRPCVFLEAKRRLRNKGFDIP